MSEDTKSTIVKVDALVKAGKAKSIADACRQLGIKPMKYYNATSVSRLKRASNDKKVKTVKRPKRRVQVIDLPQVGLPSIVPANRLLLFIGSPTEILNIAKGL